MNIKPKYDQKTNMCKTCHVHILTNLTQQNIIHFAKYCVVCPGSWIGLGYYSEAVMLVGFMFLLLN